jgi:hypothetical protein
MDDRSNTFNNAEPDNACDAIDFSTRPRFTLDEDAGAGRCRSCHSADGVWGRFTY